MLRAKQTIWSRFESKFPGSKEAFTYATKYLPGGNTKSVAFHSPHMVFAKRGVGCRIFTEENEELLDFVCAYGPLILGHCHPKVDKAVCDAVQNGILFGTNVRLQADHAKMLCERIPSIKKVRYSASGSEAVTFGIRAARAFTKKKKVLIFNGGFHGTMYTSQEWPHGNGEHSSSGDSIIVCEWNDAETLSKLIRKNRDTLACVLMEGFLGARGVIAPTKEFLRTVSEETKANGVLLVYDEITSLRCAYAGYQSEPGGLMRLPDITVCGKLLGGGHPCGIIGGSEPVMGVFDELGKNGALVRHSGSYNGHSVPLVAGIEVMKLYTKDAVARVCALGNELAVKLRKVNEKYGLLIQVNHIGALLNVHFSKTPVTNGTLAEAAMSPFQELLYLELLNNGVFVLPRDMIFVSAAHTQAEIDKFAAAYEASIAMLVPAIQERNPELVGR